jgi:general secretion pathway protein K
MRADVRTPDGARFIRDALISLGADNGQPFLIHEWRRGDIDPVTPALATQTRDDAAVSRGSCFRFGHGVGS